MPVSPRSLKNLTKMESGSEHTAEIRERSLEVRREGKKARESLKLTANELNKLAAELPKIDTRQIMVIAALKALENGDYDQAAAWAEKASPYFSPKLSSVEQNLNVDVKKYTDEELLLEAQKLGITLNQSPLALDNDVIDVEPKED